VTCLVRALFVKVNINGVSDAGFNRHSTLTWVSIDAFKRIVLVSSDALLGWDILVVARSNLNDKKTVTYVQFVVQHELIVKACEIVDLNIAKMDLICLQHNWNGCCPSCPSNEVGACELFHTLTAYTLLRTGPEKAPEIDIDSHSDDDMDDEEEIVKALGNEPVVSMILKDTRNLSDNGMLVSKLILYLCRMLVTY
jgi:hypothetical protein